jgi:hypothetical protein
MSKDHSTEIEFCDAGMLNCPKCGSRNFLIEGDVEMAVSEGYVMELTYQDNLNRQTIKCTECDFEGKGTIFKKAKWTRDELHAAIQSGLNCMSPERTAKVASIVLGVAIITERKDDSDDGEYDYMIDPEALKEVHI